MKRTFRLITFAAMLVAFALPVLAQSTECTDENKAAWYDTFLKNRNGDVPQQKTAYDSAKLYLACPVADPADAIAKYLTKWVGAYEKLKTGNQLKVQLDDEYNKKNYAEAMRVGKQILTEDPNNIKADILLGYIGNFTADANPALAAESAGYAKTAIGLVESGKTPENWQNFSKDEALAFLNRSIGFANLKNAPADAVPYLLKAVRYESSLKKDGPTYFALEQAYQTGPYTKQSDDYKIYKGQPESPAQQLALANINQILDRMIDADARAAALTTGDQKKAVMDALTELYVLRNKSETGINELVAGILSKPVPDVPTPLLSLPTPAPTPAGPGSEGAAGSKSGANTTTQSQTGSRSTVPAKSGASPAPMIKTPATKPRSHANHGRQG